MSLPTEFELYWSRLDLLPIVEGVPNSKLKDAIEAAWDAGYDVGFDCALDLQEKA